MNPKAQIAEFLNNNKIGFRYIPLAGQSFPPDMEFWTENNLRRCKNLFFRDNHGKNHIFVVLDFDRELDLGILKNLTGHQTLSFASPARLKKYLSQEPGQVSVLGLMYDIDRRIKVYLDRDLETDSLLGFLPGEKTGFLALSFAELKRFLEITGHEYRVEKLY